MTHTQGPVPLRDEDSYLDRVFQHEVVQELSAGHWVVLLGPRQHGKTSALVRIKRQFTEVGLPIALVDLQASPPHETYRDFIEWFCSSVREQVLESDNLDSSWPDTLDVGVLLLASLPEGNLPVTVLVDEASNIKDRDWRNAFYGQLRSISNKRADAAPEEGASRLRLLFSGTFHPDTLIDLENSPFNTCERIDTEDLTKDAVCGLFVRELGEGKDDLGVKAYEAVGGQPFLIQKLLAAAANAEDMEEGLSQALDKMRHGQVDHITHLFSRIIAKPKLARVVGDMAANGSVPNEPADEDYQYLQVLGLAKRDGEYLVFRNQLYAEVAQGSVQLRPEVAANNQVGIGFVNLKEETFVFVQDAAYREIALSSYNGAANAINSGSYRLALVGFGVALESILIDWLVRKSAADLANALAAAQASAQGNLLNKFENATDASTWRLVNLVRVARELNGILGPLDVPESLREMRNLVHPRQMKLRNLSEAELKPEAITASGQISTVMRDIQTP